MNSQLNIMQKNPRDPPGMQFERHMTKDLRTSNRIIRQWIERSSVWKFVIKAFAAAGVSLVIAGMLNVEELWRFMIN